MAIGNRWQGRLEQDLATGPIYYRRVPGGNRTYYDPKRPTLAPVSEHYVVRVYKPQLVAEQRALINQRVREVQQVRRGNARSLADTYVKRQAALGSPVTTANQALKDAQFKQLVHDLEVQSYQARSQNVLTNANRGKPFETGQTYSDLLVALGRRTGEETFPVGESPSHAEAGGTYIDTVVVPYLEQGTQANVEDQFNREMLSDLGYDASNMTARQIRMTLNKEGLL